MNLLGTSTSKKVFEGVGGGKYYLVNTLSDFKELIRNAINQRYIAFDTETNGLNWVFSSACGISIGWGVSDNYYIPIDHKTGEKNLDINLIRDDLISLFSDTNKIFIGHNTKFDLHILKNLGIEVKGVIHDTLTASCILNENESHGLKELSCKYLHPDADKWEKALKQWRKQEVKRRRKEYSNRHVQLTTDYIRRESETILFLSAEQKAQILLKGKEFATSVLANDIVSKNKLDDISYDYVPLDVMTPYAASDVHYTYLLYKKFILDITEDDGTRNIYFNELRLNNELFLTERAGVYVDRAYLEKISPELDSSLDSHRKSVYSSFGREFNLDSPEELVEVLQGAGVKFSKLTKASKARKDAGDDSDLVYSIDKEVLEDLARTNDYARIILEYRKAQKNKSTYVDGVLDVLSAQNYLHSSFNPNVSTGRMSCVTGDSLVSVEHDGNGKISIEDLYTYYRNSFLTVRVLTHTNTYKEVNGFLFQGTRPVYEIKMHGGACIRATDDHRLYFNDSWKYVRDLNIGSALTCVNDENEQYIDYVCAINIVGELPVYDLSVEEDHSYVANGFVNHNCTAPNLQNLPGRDKIIRKAFVPPNDDYFLVYIDYSQVELRLTAHHSLDPILLSCYPDVGIGKDVHAITGAEIILGMPVDKFNKMKGDKTGHKDGACTCPNCLYDFARFAAKRVNFGIIYGVGPKGLSKQIPGNKTEEECEEYISGYLRHYRGVSKFIKQVKRFLKENEYVINSFGRVRRFPGYRKAEYGMQARMERQAVNFMIQGDGADLFKTSVVNVGRFLRDVKAKTRMSNFVHDEIQFYWHKDEKELIPKVKAIMEDFKFCVPIVAEVSYSQTSWADKKEWK